LHSDGSAIAHPGPGWELPDRKRTQAPEFLRRIRSRQLSASGRFCDNPRAVTQASPGVGPARTNDRVLVVWQASLQGLLEDPPHRRGECSGLLPGRSGSVLAVSKV